MTEKQNLILEMFLHNRSKTSNSFEERVKFAIKDSEKFLELTSLSKVDPLKWFETTEFLIPESDKLPETPVFISHTKEFLVFKDCLNKFNLCNVDQCIEKKEVFAISIFDANTEVQRIAEKIRTR